MTDYAEYITEINRLKREIHDACLAKQWHKAAELSSQLKGCAYSLYAECVQKMVTQ